MDFFGRIHSGYVVAVENGNKQYAGIFERQVLYFAKMSILDLLVNQDVYSRP